MWERGNRHKKQQPSSLWSISAARAHRVIARKPKTITVPQRLATDDTAFARPSTAESGPRCHMMGSTCSFLWPISRPMYWPAQVAS